VTGVGVGSNVGLAVGGRVGVGSNVGLAVGGRVGVGGSVGVAVAVGVPVAAELDTGSGVVATVTHDTTAAIDTARTAYERLALARRGGRHDITK
jgi:hypothetical protein